MNALGDVGASRLAGMLRVNSTLRELHLEQNGIGDSGAISLAEAVEDNHALRELWLINNPIGGAGITRFAEALETNDVLTRLGLTTDSAVASSIPAGLKALRRSHMVKRAVRIVAEGNERLELGGQELGDRGASRIAAAIENTHSLRVLKLRNCQINDAGAVRLAEALEMNTSLSDISLAQNAISDEGGWRLAEALSRSSTIENLDLAGNPLGEEVVERIQLLTPRSSDLHMGRARSLAGGGSDGSSGSTFSGQPALPHSGAPDERSFGRAASGDSKGTPGGVAPLGVGVGGVFLSKDEAGASIAEERSHWPEGGGSLAAVLASLDEETESVAWSEPVDDEVLIDAKLLDRVLVGKLTKRRGPTAFKLDAGAGAPLRVPDDDPDDASPASDFHDPVPLHAFVANLDGDSVPIPEPGPSPNGEVPTAPVTRQPTIPEEVDLDVTMLNNAVALSSSRRFHRSRGSPSPHGAVAGSQGSTEKVERVCDDLDGRSVASESTGSLSDTGSVSSERMPDLSRIGGGGAGLSSFRPPLRSVI